MTVVPLVVVISWPSTMILTGSIKIKEWNVGILGRWNIDFRSPPSLQYSSTRLSHSHRAFLFLDVCLEFVAIFLDKRRRRHGRCVTEWTNRIAHDVAADIKNQIEIA